MEVRTAEAADIPAIVSLLKISLGESLMPKSEEYWRWKHIDNPFGASPVLLAIENDQVIGVRAFMQWCWKGDGRIFRAVRAVDTATHPEHQGKGVFKKLTLGLIDECRTNGFSFVFNTPNAKSKPGYLKMGWKEAGQFPISIYLRQPVRCAFNLLSRTTIALPPADDSVEQCIQHAGVDALLQSHAAAHSHTVISAHTSASLRWRYQTVPVVKYHACMITREKELFGAAFFRFKQTKLGLEMRVTDLFLASGTFSDEMQEMLMAEAQKRMATFVTISSLHEVFRFRGLLSLPVLRLGPIVTIRDIHAMPEDKLTGFQGWNATTGDLELF